MALQATGTAPTITDPSDTQGITVNGNTWTYTNNNGSEATDTNSAKYNNNQLIWTESNGVYTVKRKVGNTTSKTNGTAESFDGFNIRFSNNSNGESTLLPLTIETWNESSRSVKKAGLLVSKNVNTFTLDFGGKGFQLGGTNGSKIWTFHFQDTGKTVTIDKLSSLEGSLYILSEGNQTTNNTLTINLGSMKGNILLQGDYGASTQNITFNGSGLEGNIEAKNTINATQNGALNVVFNNNATMTGDIKGHGVGYDGLKRVITFDGGANKTVLTGNVFSYGTSMDSTKLNKSAGNHITFNQGNMTGSIIATVGNGLTSQKGYNNITFSGTEHTLIGGILADDQQNNGADQQATNTLNLGANTTLKMIANSDTSKNSVTDKDSICAGGSAKGGEEQYGTTNKKFDLTTGSIIAKGGINEINLDEGATLILNSGNGEVQTQSNQSNNNTKSIITFKGANGTLQGKITTSAGTATINIANDASATITGDITTGTAPLPPRRGVSAKAGVGSGTNTITLGTSANLTTNAREGDNSQSPTPESTPATASLTLQGSTNTINNLTASAEKSTLIVDGNLNANTTTITTITDGNHLTLNLNGRGESKGATAKLINNSSELTLKALTLGNGSTHNTLDLTGRTGKTTITDQISVSNGQGVTIKLKGQELELTGGMNTTGGTSTINVTANGASANATLSGGDVTLTNLDLVAGNAGSQDAQLTLKNDNTTISTITANTESDTIAANKKNGAQSSPKLTLDAQGASKAVTASTSSISGNGLILELKGGDSSKNATFNINGGSNTIKTLTLSGNSNNILNANGGNTTITDAISLDNKTLDLGIGNGNLTLTNHLTAGNSNTGTANINFTGNGTLTSNLSVGSSGTLTSNLSTTATNGTININVASGDGTIAGTLNNGNNTGADSKGININFKGSGSSLSLIDSSALSTQDVAQKSNPVAHTINTLKAEGEGNILNLSGQARNSGVLPNRVTFQTLKINDLKADSKSINFIVYANPEANNGNSPRADRIIIEGSNASAGAGGASAGTISADAQNTGTPKTHYLGVVGDPHKIIGKDLYDPSGSNNIALATVKTSSNITLEAVTNISGFSLITYEYQTASTDESGKVQKSKNNSNNNDYTTYFLGSAKSLGATEASQEVSASALATNYDLYLANMNSLNKRMGELRDNPHSQGVWARVFNGMQTSNFALETQAVYTTIQAGYDYAFGFEGGNNYVGVALSYANSSTKSKTINELNQTTNTTQTKGIDAVTSNAVEIAVYNSYVQDGASAQSGWSNGLFSDSIVKFSYISSDLTLLDQSNTYNTTNYALTLSQEIGYRFLLGSEGEWNIDPQAEVALGYLNQSNLRQTLSAQNYLDGIQNAIVTLRSRVGASFGYDFKKFTEGKSINAKLYVGAYYVYDYIAGGDVSLTDNFGAKVSLSPLASTGRAVMNVGTNIGVQDNTRIYFDFEKSFGGDITTDYQVNLGVRYSFGESNGYMPKGTKIETKAPLRVEETKEKQEQTQTSKNQESAEVKQESKKAQ